MSPRSLTKHSRPPRRLVCWTSSSSPSARDMTPVGSSVPSSTHSRASSSASVWLSSTLTDPTPSASLIASPRRTSRLHVAAREDRRDEVEHVGRRHFVVTEVLDQPLLDHIDLVLG